MYAISQVEVSVCVTAVKDVSVSVTVGLPLSLERNTLVLTVAVILTTAIVRSTLRLVGREGRREGEKRAYILPATTEPTCSVYVTARYATRPSTKPVGRLRSRLSASKPADRTYNRL